MLNVRDFGAVGDGFADDTAAIQKAIDAAWAKSVGGSVYFPSGVYVVSALILPAITGAVTTNKVLRLHGAAPGSSSPDQRTSSGAVLKCNTDASDVISVAGGGHLHFANPKYVFEDLSIIGPDTVHPRTTNSGNGIYLVGGAAVPIVVVRNLTISNFYGSGTSGFRLSGDFEGGQFDSLRVLNCDIGMQVGPTFNQNIFSNLQVDQNATIGLHINGATSIAINGGLVQSNEKDGVRITAGTAVSFNNIHFENNNCGENNSGPTSGRYAINLHTIDGHIQKISFNNCYISTPSQTALYVCGSATKQVYGVYVSGGYWQGASFPHIYLDGDYISGVHIHEAVRPHQILKVKDPECTVHFRNMFYPPGINATDDGNNHRVGEIIYRQTPTPGGYLGWVCTTAGRYGTYNEGRTAATDGTPTVTLDSSSSELKAGDHVTILATSVQIISISGTKMVVDKAIPAGGPGLAICYTAPLFKEFGPISL